MAETSLPWGNNGIGDGQSYDDDEWSDWQRKTLTVDRTKQGPIAGYNNELLVSNPAGYTLRVATGAAWVDGKFYENDANLDFTTTDNGTAIGAPGAGTNYYTVVLRKTWATQVVRAAVLDVSAVAYPTATQTDGTTWEIVIGYMSVTSGGVKTVTDARKFAQPMSCPPLIARQGNSATDWDDANCGTTTYKPGAVAMQVGSIELTTDGAFKIATVNITYPIAFAYKPIVFVTCAYEALTGTPFATRLRNQTASGCTIELVNSAGGLPPDMRVNWQAIGPV